MKKINIGFLQNTEIIIWNFFFWCIQTFHGNNGLAHFEGVSNIGRDNNSNDRMV